MKHLSTLVMIALVVLVASCGTVRNGGGLMPTKAAPAQNIQFCQTSPNYWEVCKHEKSI